MAVAALAAFLNPYGLGIIAYFFTATGDKTARDLNIEWQPPTLYNGTGILFFANVGLFLLLLLASRRRVGWTEGLLMGAFGFLALLSIRNVIWWGWVTAPGSPSAARRCWPCWRGRCASTRSPPQKAARRSPPSTGPSRWCCGRGALS